MRRFLPLLLVLTACTPGLRKAGAVTGALVVHCVLFDALCGADLRRSHADPNAVPRCGDSTDSKGRCLDEEGRLVRPRRRSEREQTSLERRSMI